MNISRHIASRFSTKIHFFTPKNLYGINPYQKNMCSNNTENKMVKKGIYDTIKIIYFGGYTTSMVIMSPYISYKCYHTYGTIYDKHPAESFLAGILFGGVFSIIWFVSLPLMTYEIIEDTKKYNQD